MFMCHNHSRIRRKFGRDERREERRESSSSSSSLRQNDNDHPSHKQQGKQQPTRVANYGVLVNTCRNESSWNEKCLCSWFIVWYEDTTTKTVLAVCDHLYKATEAPIWLLTDHSGIRRLQYNGLGALGGPGSCMGGTSNHTTKKMDLEFGAALCTFSKSP